MGEPKKPVTYDPRMDTGVGKGGKVPSRGGGGCLGCLGVIAIVAVAFGVYAATRDDSGDQAELRSVMAQNACEDAVRTSLKAPSTAEFPATNSTGSGDYWHVAGAVDAENSFGAKLRNSFECSVSFKDDRAHATVTKLE